MTSLLSLDTLCVAVDKSSSAGIINLRQDVNNVETLEFLEIAKSFVPDIKRATPEITEGREIPAELINSMADAGLFRLYIPKSVGGHEVDYLYFLKILFEVAKADGSMGWCFNQNNVLSTISAFMPKELAEKIWSDQRTILSNGPPVNPEVEVLDDGYKISGRWNFSSGSRHAKWVVALVPIKGRAGIRPEAPEMRNMLIPKEQVEFIDTWQVSGLRGTGSFSFTADELFVPEGHSFIEGNPPREGGPLYVIPKTLLFCSGFATTALGVARSGLDSIIELSEAKTPQEQDLLQSQPFTHRELGMAEAVWRAARSYLEDSVNEAWEWAKNERIIPLEQRINLRLSSTHAIRESVKVADMAYSLAGSSAIFERTPIQRKFQDVRVISQQIQGRMTHYDTAGQYFLGLEPQGRLF